MTEHPRLFRVTLEVGNLDQATQLYSELLGILAPYQVHGQPAAEVITRPWGERSFYVVDPWGNDLCFCEDGTLYT